jgi:hypothetical protein
MTCEHLVLSEISVESKYIVCCSQRYRVALRDIVNLRALVALRDIGGVKVHRKAPVCYLRRRLLHQALSYYCIIRPSV